MNAIATKETSALATVIPDDIYTETGLKLPAGKLPFEEYEQVGVNLQRMLRASNWWLGDWILYGDSQYGETYTQAIDFTGRGEDHLKNIVSICRSIPPEERRAVLSFSSHAAVAGLTAAVRREVLDEAEEKGLNSKQIRVLARDVKTRATSDGTDEKSRRHDLSDENGHRVIDVEAEEVEEQDEDKSVFDQTGSGQRMGDERADREQGVAAVREAKPADIVNQIIELIEFLPPRLKVGTAALAGVDVNALDLAALKLIEMMDTDEMAPAGAPGFPDNTGQQSAISSGANDGSPSEPSSDATPSPTADIAGESEQSIADQSSGNEAAEIDPNALDAGGQGDDPQSIGFDRGRYNSETITTDELLTFYEEGATAFNDGTALTFCPDLDPKDYQRAWVDGWQSAKALARAELAAEEEAATTVHDDIPTFDTSSRDEDVPEIPAFMDRRDEVAG